MTLAVRTPGVVLTDAARQRCAQRGTRKDDVA